MVKLKVCPCFRFSEREEFMETVANRPWDAWHVITDGERFIMNYEKDGFYNYLTHLLHNPMCRWLVDLNFPTVLVWFSRLEESRQSLNLRIEWDWLKDPPRTERRRVSASPIFGGQEGAEWRFASAVQSL
jgi:hypothetical protein